MPAILDTRQLPRVDRIAAAAFLEHTDTPIRLASNAAEQLGHRFSGWQLAAGVQVLDMEGSVLRMTRSARPLRALARERLCLAAQFRGEGTLEHMGFSGVTAPGQLNLIVATSESGYLWTGKATRRISLRGL